MASHQLQNGQGMKKGEKEEKEEKEEREEEGWEQGVLGLAPMYLRHGWHVTNARRLSVSMLNNVCSNLKIDITGEVSDGTLYISHTMFFIAVRFLLWCGLARNKGKKRREEKRREEKRREKKRIAC